MIDEVPDARIKFHLHRVTASVCKVQRMFRLVNPRETGTIAQNFADDQLRAYSRYNNVRISATIAE